LPAKDLETSIESAANTALTAQKGLIVYKLFLDECLNSRPQNVFNELQLEEKG
jgi:hypothetical protein